jgi:hypothetical protein
MYIPIWLFVLTILLYFVFYRQTHILFRQEKEAEFDPIRISIEAKWDELFKDYKVVDDDSWKKKIPDSKDYNVLKNGINFTSLKSNLFYDNDRHCFKTEVNFRRQIDEVSPLKYGTDFVGICVKSSIEGYVIGIRTVESHNKQIKEAREYKADFGDDSDLIKIATIPYSEFLFPLYDRQSKKKQVEIDQNLQKFGWTRTAPDVEFSRFDSEVILDHKYFCVSYDYI